MKKILLAALMLLTLLLTGCAAPGNDAEVIRLGDVVYTRADVEAEVNNNLAYMQWYYGQYGMQYDVTDKNVIAATRQAVVDELVQQAVLADKARQLGLDVLTEEESAALASTVTSAWRSYRLSIEQEKAFPEGTPREEIEKAVDEVASSEGVSYERLLAHEKLALMDQKLKAMVYQDVTVTEEETAAALAQKAEEARTAYAANPSAYGAALLSGGTVYYRPAGYRLVKQILIAAKDADTDLVAEIDAALTAAISAEQAAAHPLTYDEVMQMDELLACVTVTMAKTENPTADVTAESVVTAFPEGTPQDTQERITALARATAVRAELEKQVLRAEKQALDAIAPRANEVLAALERGEDWDALSLAYNDDPGMKPGAAFAAGGYPVCEGFTRFDPAFVTAAMAIPEKGMWSDKTEGSYGYYIILYADDVPEGPAHDDAAAAALQDSLLAQKQTDAYTAAVIQWTREADVKISMDALK